MRRFPGSRRIEPAILRNMSLSSQAKQLLDQLPQDGEKVGGITLQRELSITKVAYQKAREELKTEGLVKVGGGRGGSLARVPGAEPKEEEHTTTQAERLEYAREAKVAKSREQKELDRQIELIYGWAKDKLSYDVKTRSDCYLYNGEAMVAVWKGHKADVIVIPQLEWDQLNAIQR